MAETIIIDGKAFAASLRAEMAEKVSILSDRFHITPGLAVIMAGDNPASEVYVKNKIKYTKEVGMNSFEFKMPHDITQKHLIAKIENLNNDPKVHGILVQLPLPDHINEFEVINTIAPAKDVDGFTCFNAGKLITGQNGLVPCTPLGCLRLIKSICPDLTSKKAVIIGRSNIVGKPMAHLLLKENCTVTIVHSKTHNIMAETRTADILISAVGVPNLVKQDWIKPGAIVIDVGINRVHLEDGRTKLVGDIDFIAAQELASAITPVPGGVGPMTIACLLENTLKAASDIHNVSF